MPIGVLSSYLVVSSKNRTFVLDYNNIKTIITANEET